MYKINFFLSFDNLSKKQQVFGIGTNELIITYQEKIGFKTLEYVVHLATNFRYDSAKQK